jgi:hypothetical protein
MRRTGSFDVHGYQVSWSYQVIWIQASEFALWSAKVGASWWYVPP